MSDTRRGAIRGVLYLTQLWMCVCAAALAEQSVNMSSRFNDAAGQLDMEQYDCVSAGEPWRNYKLRARRILAGKVDDSSSSLADAMANLDMGGTAAGAIVIWDKR